MSVSAGLLPEFDQEMTKTRKTLERVPMDRFDWRPHERSFGMGELANHLARLPGWGKETMLTESLDLAPDGKSMEEPPVARATADLLVDFDRNSAAFRDALAKASDEAFLASWTLYQGGNELLTLPRIAVIRNLILNHMIHHRGQLTVYLRMNGIPVPALYGPSADEST
jgi:uncharacterized damage-inducible protein DinB